MADPRHTHTNAADSAPGVDDGKVRGDGPAVNSKPGGRGLAWWIVGISLLILAVVFLARPMDSSREEQASLAIDGALPMDMTPAPATP